MTDPRTAFRRRLAWPFAALAIGVLPTAVLTVVLGVAITRWATHDPDGPSPSTTTTHAGYRTAFDPGDAGWAQFEALAAPAQTAAGRTFEVLAMLVDVRGTAPGVYFIPSAADGSGRRPIHYDFSRAILRRKTRAWTRLSFDAFTYGVDKPSQIAPILTWYPDRTLPAADGRPPIVDPVALRFAPNARLSADDIALAHRLLAARMRMLSDAERAAGEASIAQLVHIPNGFTHADAIRAMSTTLRAAGVPWASAEALSAGVRFQALNPGVAVGRLRIVAVETAASAIGADDIVLLDDLPLDLPIVAGTITPRLQTTLAHVNVLARARGTPNMALIDAARDPRIAPFVGQLVRLEVTATDFAIRPATADEARAFAAARRPAPLGLPRVDLSVTAIRSLDDVDFAASASVGAKAANLAELHRLLPDVAPGGLAVPFSAYAAHVASIDVSADACEDWRRRCANSLPGKACDGAAAVCIGIIDASTSSRAVGFPLSAYLDRLLGDPTFATDSAVRSAALHGVRTAIERAPIDAAFGGALVDAARAEWGDQSFRLRSSTNAEDLPDFSGAGLYDSVTATVDPGDDYAPDRIRKVWASVWTFRAFEERAWWGVPHRAVQMGVLVSRAYPDEDANGVLVTTNLAEPDATGFTINAQPGELSVTNATDGAFPEVLVVQRRLLGSWRTERLQASSASIDRPVLTPAEIDVLADAARRAQRHFARLYGLGEADASFEIEFKVDGRAPGIVLKQIRPLASP